MAKRLTSILTEDMETCYLTGMTYWVERHHIFGGANRKASEVYGLIVPLQHHLHEEKFGVHQNRALDLQLKQCAQRAFEAVHGTREEFMLIFGKNYLWEETDGYEIDLRACGIPYIDEAC